MSEPKLISPMLDNFAIGGPISEHHGVICCPAMENDFNDKYIVKIISVPASQTQFDALLLTGAFSTPEAALEYFRETATGIQEESRILDQLSRLEGFLPYRACQCEAKEDGTGYDVYFLSPYRRSLTRQFKSRPLTQLEVLNLGLDICAALSVCRRCGYLYVNLKPNNIYLTDDKGYYIGDIGFISLDSLRYASLPERYTSQYTAPEVSDAFSALNTTMDIYALGLILYQAYNNGSLPVADEDGIFPPPEYADYEMSEIIMKALHKDTAERWQDPTQMGQALVEYMQRNGANDVPIIPPAPVVDEAETEETTDSSVDVETFEETDATVTSDENITLENEHAIIPPVQDEAEPAPVELFDPSSQIGNDSQADPEDDTPAEDEFINLSFLDDTEENPDISYDEISNELSDILEQADELVSHPVPEPAVAPEPVEIPVPEPIILEEDEAEPTQQVDQPIAPDCSEDDFIEKSEAAEEVVADDAMEAYDESAKKRCSWLRGIIALLIVAGLLAGAYFYYQNYYLQTIDSVVTHGTEDRLSVTVHSDIEDSLLNVICADPHGNQIPAKVVDGKAEFSKLLPNTTYTVTVEIEGFHQLIGTTTATYSTPQQSTIVQYSSVTGSEDGSVILGFTVDGPDSDNWCVTYSAEDEEAQQVTFSGHSVSLTGLTVGKEYTFTIEPESFLYLSGTNELKHTASKLIYAQDLEILSCMDNSLTVGWTVPADTQVESWTVRCVGEDYSQSMIVTEPAAIFEDLDHTGAYTVEVVAAGMSVSQRVQVQANSVTITNFQGEATGADQLTLTWDTSRQVGENGWILKSYINGAEAYAPIICAENTAVISDIVPGAVYTFTLEDLDHSQFLGIPVSCQTEDAQLFTCDYDNREITAEDITFSMVRRPEKSNWNRFHLYDEDYTTTFHPAEKASFLMHMEKRYGNSWDQVTTKFIIHDEAGALVSVDTQEAVWNDMWLYSYGELDIPRMPSAPGVYTISVYFDGAFVKSQQFTIAE